MAAEVLAHKLEGRHDRNPEQSWSLSRWPSRFSEPGEHRLFVASEGAWRGYFILAKDGLYNADDPAAPFTLLFDARTWKTIPSDPARRFRGFTYTVPALEPSPPTTPTPPTAAVPE